MIDPNLEITMLADIPNRKIGCVLLQAMHCRSYCLVSELFDPATWETAPTPNLQRVTGTRAEWERYAELCNRTHDRKYRESPTS